MKNKMNYHREKHHTATVIHPPTQTPLTKILNLILNQIMANNKVQPKGKMI